MTHNNGRERSGVNSKQFHLLLNCGASNLWPWVTCLGWETGLPIQYQNKIRNPNSTIMLVMSHSIFCNWNKVALYHKELCFCFILQTLFSTGLITICFLFDIQNNIRLYFYFIYLSTTIIKSVHLEYNNIKHNIKKSLTFFTVILKWQSIIDF